MSVHCKSLWSQDWLSPVWLLAEAKPQPVSPVRGRLGSGGRHRVARLPHRARIRQVRRAPPWDPAAAHAQEVGTQVRVEPSAAHFGWRLLATEAGSQVREEAPRAPAPSAPARSHRRQGRGQAQPSAQGSRSGLSSGQRHRMRLLSCPVLVGKSRILTVTAAMEIKQ